MDPTYQFLPVAAVAVTRHRHVERRPYRSMWTWQPPVWLAVAAWPAAYHHPNHLRLDPPTAQDTNISNMIRKVRKVGCTYGFTVGRGRWLLLGRWRQIRLHRFCVINQFCANWTIYKLVLHDYNPQIHRMGQTIIIIYYAPTSSDMTSTLETGFDGVSSICVSLRKPGVLQEPSWCSWISVSSLFSSDEPNTSWK